MAAAPAVVELVEPLLVVLRVLLVLAAPVVRGLNLLVGAAGALVIGSRVALVAQVVMGQIRALLEARQVRPVGRLRGVRGLNLLVVGGN